MTCQLSSRLVSTVPLCHGMEAGNAGSSTFVTATGWKTSPSGFKGRKPKSKPHICVSDTVFSNVYFSSAGSFRLKDFFALAVSLSFLDLATGVVAGRLVEADEERQPRVAIGSSATTKRPPPRRKFSTSL